MERMSFEQYWRDVFGDQRDISIICDLYGVCLDDLDDLDVWLTQCELEACLPPGPAGAWQLWQAHHDRTLEMFKSFLTH